MVESQASLFGLKFWTFNLDDNLLILEPVFGVEGRSTTVLTLRFTPKSHYFSFIFCYQKLQSHSILLFYILLYKPTQILHLFRQI